MTTTSWTGHEEQPKRGRPTRAQELVNTANKLADIERRLANLEVRVRLLAALFPPQS